MVDDQVLKRWFCEEVLPLERQLMAFLRHHGRGLGDLIDFRQDVYEKILAAAAQNGLPQNSRAYVMVTARNMLINATRRSKIVSFELVADLEELDLDADMFATERQMNARDELRKTQAAMDALPARCREVVRLCKVEGHSVQETAMVLRVSRSLVEKELTSGMRAISNHLLGSTSTAHRPAGRLLRLKERRS